MAPDRILLILVATLAAIGLGALLAAIGAAAAHWPRLATIVAVPLAVGIAVVAHIVIDRLRRAPADPYERQNG